MTEEGYVKLETNVEWYNAKDIVYLTLIQVIVSFQKKMMENLKKNPNIVFKPMMKKADADAIGATYIVDADDYKERTVKNPFKGEEFYTLSFDTDGEPVWGEANKFESDFITQPAALAEDEVFIELAPTLNTLMQDYLVAKADYRLDDWYDKAMRIVPMLWD